MKSFGRNVLILAATAVCAFVAYNVLLTPEAKRNVAKTGKKLREVADMAVQEYAGLELNAQEEEKLARNKAWITKQWEQSGLLG